MRLALVLYGHLGMVSGGFLYDRLLVEYLRRQGVRVEVVSIPWRRYPGGGILRNLDPTLYRRLMRVPAELLLQDELAHPSLILPNLCLRRRRPLPLVSLVHHLRCCEEHPSWLTWLYRQEERLYLHTVHGFIFNSEATRQSVEDLGIRGRPYVVAYPGGDRFQRTLSQEAIAARCRRVGPLRLLFLGNVIPRKGLHTLLAALELLPREGWRLTVTGDLKGEPAYVKRLQKRVHDNDWDSQVKFTGLLGKEQVAGLLAQSDLLVVPSFYEGFGMAYLEGMAFGLPAVATTAGGAKEFITHGQDGFLIPPGDLEALARSLFSLMTDRERLLGMSLAARARFLRHPTWEESCAAIHRFLLNMVENFPTRPV